MEGLVAFGTAVNVLTLVDMACKTISRIQEYTDQAAEIPQSLCSTQLCLPLLADFLNRAKEQGLYGQAVVRDVLVEFNKVLGVLEKETQRIISLPTDTRRRRLTKAIVSLRADTRIQRAERDITKYQQNLTLWIVGSSSTTMGLAKITVPKRAKFFNYRPECNGHMTSIQEMVYNEVTTSLLLRRHEVMSTSVAAVSVSWFYLRVDTLSSRLATEMQKAGHAEVILYLEPYDFLLRTPNLPVTIEEYLQYLQLPQCATPEEGWDTLRMVLEEWQRPFLLIIALWWYSSNSLRRHMSTIYHDRRMALAVPIADYDYNPRIDEEYGSDGDSENNEDSQDGVCELVEEQDAGKEIIHFAEEEEEEEEEDEDESTNEDWDDALEELETVAQKPSAVDEVFAMESLATAVAHDSAM